MPFILFLAWILYLFFPTLAFAQTQPMIAATPSIIRLDLRTDKPDTVIYYKNLSKEPIDLSLSAKDFNGLDDTGTVHFLDEPDAQNYNYSLSSWIHFESESVSLNPGEQKAIAIHIDKEKLPVGGHYASIIAEVIQRDTQGIIPLRGILSTLLFVRAGKGYERENARVTTVESDTTFPYFPQEFFFKLQNTGNIDLIPYGLLEITDMFGRKVATGIVNEGSLITLPESIRKYKVAITSKSFLIPGVYHAHLQIHYGEKNKQASADTTFWSQGSIPLVLIFGIILTIIILVGVYRLWKKPFRDNESARGQ